MVSFFGLKIGGDKKKPQSKETKQPQQWKRIDQNTLGEGQYFGTDLKRPAFPSSRPGSSQSVKAPPVLWNGPYAGPGTTSSMVDLTMPPPGRKESFSSLRTTNKASDTNLMMRWANGSAADLAPPLALANSRPGTPTRPGTSSGASRKKEWVNPLDVHFGKPATSSSRPGTPTSSSFSRPPPLRSSTAPTEMVLPQPNPPVRPPLRSSTAPSEVVIQQAPSAAVSGHTRGASSNTSVRSHIHGPSITNVHGRGPSLTNVHNRGPSLNSVEPVGQTGYPSPPKSVSPISIAESQAFPAKPNAPSTLRQVDVAAVSPLSPPSPASSVSPTTEQHHLEDEEEWAIPVIQDVRAKRDTLTYHPPRRQSFTMELGSNERDRQVSETVQIQSVREPERVIDEPWMPPKRERRFEVDEEQDPRPKNKHVEGLSGNFAAFDFGDSVRRQSIEPAKTEEEQPSRRPKPRIDAIETQNFTDARRPSAPEVWHSSTGDDRADSPIMHRGRPRFGPPPDRTWSNPSSPVRGQQPDWRAPSGLSDPAAPPPRSASRPRAPDGAPKFGQRQAGPPRAAAGAHRGNAERMAYGPTALNPPPSRGFQPHLDDSRSHNRAPPPRPLRVPEQVVDLRRSPDHPPLSPLSPSPLIPAPFAAEGPITGESEYFSADMASPQYSERPATSPYNRQPMEGDFPKHRGLPRGRTPQPPPGEAPVSPLSPGSSSRWKQWRSSVMRSPKTEAQQQPAEEADVPEHGYTLPNWDDFDERSDRHRSAIPPPLTPYSPYSPWSGEASSSALTSPTAPRLPSPTFPSLEKSISSSNENLAKTFELFYEDSRDHIPEPAQSQLQPQQPPQKPQVPLISPVANDFPEQPKSQSPRRVDAVKAPPRPAPITVPPSPREGLPTSEFGMRSPALVPNKEFSAGFI